MTTFEFFRSASEAELSNYITNMIVAYAEHFAEKEVAFERTLAIFGATQKLMQYDMPEEVIDDNKKSAMFRAVTTTNLRMLGGYTDE